MNGTDGRATGKAWTAALFLAPSVLPGAFLFSAAFALAFLGAFTDWDGLSPPIWVGFDNFLYLLSGAAGFSQALAITLIFGVGQLAIGLPLAFGLALAAQVSSRKSLWRSVYWLPMVTNIVAIAYIWAFLLRDGDGFLDRVGSLFGFASAGWLTNPDVALFSLILVFVWMHLGQQVLIIMDALSNIEASLIEAARLDGANDWQVFAFVQLPLLKPTLLFLAVTGVVQAMSTFVLMLVLTNGGPAQSTDVAALFIYRTAFDDLRIGRALAAGLILLGVIAGLTLIQMRLLRRGGMESAMT